VLRSESPGDAIYFFACPNVEAAYAEFRGKGVKVQEPTGTGLWHEGDVLSRIRMGLQPFASSGWRNRLLAQQSGGLFRQDLDAVVELGT